MNDDMNKTNHPISSNNHTSATAKKQYTASIERGGGLQNQREHPKILIKYSAAVSENYSSSGMLTILIKAQTVSI